MITAEIKERPILFSGPMVRAILEGRKTQTRRVVKPMPFIDFPTGFRLQEQYKLDHHPKCSFVQAGMLCDCKAIYEPWKAERIAACPYGQPGDRLWVRENFRLMKWHDSDPAGKLTPPEHIYYPVNLTNNPPEEIFGRPRIARFMPRWASRITLEITQVRVERLQSISEEDARAEGMYTNEQAIEKLNLPANTKLTGSCVDKFRIVWDSINGKTYPWSSNPWVWVLEFKKVWR